MKGFTEYRWRTLRKTRSLDEFSSRPVRANAPPRWQRLAFGLRRLLLLLRSTSIVSWTFTMIRDYYTNSGITNADLYPTLGYFGGLYGINVPQCLCRLNEDDGSIATTLDQHFAKGVVHNFHPSTDRAVRSGSQLANTHICGLSNHHSL